MELYYAVQKYQMLANLVDCMYCTSMNTRVIESGSLTGHAEYLKQENNLPALLSW
jgi:hypothetical protein